MDAKTFIAIARSLKRPCHRLTEATSPGQAFAYWGGRGPAAPGSDHLQHRISVAARLFDQACDPSTWLSVYIDNEEMASCYAQRRTVSDPESVFEGLPLAATAAESLPPIDAVFLFGGEQVHGWLAQLEWPPEWGFNDNFPALEIVEPYAQIYQDSCPLYTEDAHAVLGGWHFPWPDDDWQDRLADSLVLWTLAEAEPWIEVWEAEGDLIVRQRLT